MAITIPATRSLLLDRVRLVLTHPAICWPTIAAESRGTKELFLSITLPLLLVGTLCSFAGAQLFGLIGSAFSTKELAQQTFISFALSCASPYVSAFVLTKLAPFFQSSATYEKAFSWSVHSSIPALTAGIFSLFPLLGAIVYPFFGFLSLYAAYSGLPTMTNVPQNQRVALFISFVVAMILVGLLMAVLLVAAVV